MKLDKITFARLVHFISSRLDSPHITEVFITSLDEIIDFHDIGVKAKASDIDELLRQIADPEGFIPAIKAYRVLTGEGLKEAKEAVERYRVVNNSSDRSAKQIKNDMIDSLNREDCIIHPSNRNSVRDFVESFSHYK